MTPTLTPVRPGLHSRMLDFSECHCHCHCLGEKVRVPSVVTRHGHDRVRLSLRHDWLICTAYAFNYSSPSRFSSNPSHDCRSARRPAPSPSAVMKTIPRFSFTFVAVVHVTFLRRNHAGKLRTIDDVQQHNVPSVDFTVTRCVKRLTVGAQLGAWTVDEKSAFRQIRVHLVHRHLFSDSTM